MIYMLLVFIACIACYDNSLVGNGSSTNSRGNSNETYDQTKMDNMSMNSTEVLTTSYPVKVTEGLISGETFDQFDNVSKYLFPIIAFVGIIVNVLNVLVFSEKSMKNATSCYLIGIGVMQIGSIVFDNVINVYQLLHGDASEDVVLLRMRLYLNTYVGEVLSRIVYYLVMIVAFERMLAVVFPLKRERSRLVKHPNVCILLVIIVNFIFHVFTPLRYSITTSGDDDNITYSVEISKYDQNIINKFNFMSKIIFVYLPLLAILICNTILCVALKRHVNSAKNISAAKDVSLRETKERQTTVAIMVSTFFFLLLALPLATNGIVSNILPNDYSFFSDNMYTFRFMLRLTALLKSLSFSTDFLTYVFMSSKFRSTLRVKCYWTCNREAKVEDGSLRVTSDSLT